MKVKIDKNYHYDPQRQGYDTNLWKTLSGTPEAASNKLRVSAAECIQYADLFQGFFNLVTNVPATPTNAYLTGGTGATSVAGTWAAVTDGEFTISIDGVEYDIEDIDFTGAATMAAVAVILQAAIRAATEDSHTTVVWSTNKFIITARKSITVTSAVSGGSGTDISGVDTTAFLDAETGKGTVTAATNSNKIWGLIQLNKGLKCYFELRGDTLLAVTSDDSGTAQETDITWLAAWTAADITFEFDWDCGSGVKFMVNGNQVAYHDVTIPRSSMNLYLYNEFADNFDFEYIEAKAVQTLI